jgi:hypothetical protein
VLGLDLGQPTVSEETGTEIVQSWIEVVRLAPRWQHQDVHQSGMSNPAADAEDPPPVRFLKMISHAASPFRFFSASYSERQ